MTKHHIHTYTHTHTPPKKASFKYLLTIFLTIIIVHYGNKWPTSFSQNYLMAYEISKLEKINKLVLLIPLIWKSLGKDEKMYLAAEHKY